MLRGIGAVRHVDREKDDDHAGQFDSGEDWRKPCGPEHRQQKVRDRRVQSADQLEIVNQDNRYRHQSDSEQPEYLIPVCLCYSYDRVHHARLTVRSEVVDHGFYSQLPAG